MSFTHLSQQPERRRGLYSPQWRATSYPRLGYDHSLADVGNIVVGSHHGVPIYISNLGRAAFAPMIRQGAVTHDGKGETVAGVVMLLIGQNSRTVVDRVKAKLAADRTRFAAGCQYRSLL